MAWDLPDDIVDATDRTAEHFNKFRSCFNELALHDHSGLDGRGAVLTGRLGMMDRQTMILFNTNGSTICQNTTTGLLGGIIATSTSTGSVNIALSYIYLRAGTYTFSFYYVSTGLVRTFFSIAYLNQNSIIADVNGAVSNVFTVNFTALYSGSYQIQVNPTFSQIGSTVSVYAMFFARTGNRELEAPLALQWKTQTFSPGEVLTATALNQFETNFRILESHKHSGEIGDGSAVISGDSSQSVLPQVQILARFPKSTTGFTYSTSSNYRLGFVAQSSAQNDEIVFPVGLQAGTYRLEFLYGKGSDCGIATFYLDATLLGTIDTYAASTSYNDNSSVSGITVASSGWYNFKIKMATKNASSSGYVCRWQAVNIVRTA